MDVEIDKNDEVINEKVSDDLDKTLVELAIDYDSMVETQLDNAKDEIKEIENLKKRIHHNIASLIGINAKINLVEPHTIERFEGKAKRVIDKRK